MSRHVSAENLALYREGVLSPRRQARIGAHLSGCDTCTAVDSGLADVSGLLARSPAPRMPDLLAQRIQLALAGEAAARAAAAGVKENTSAGRAADQAAPVPGRPDLPERARRRAWRPRMPDLTSPVVLRALAAAGVIVVIAGAGLLLAKNQPRQAGSGSGGRAAPAAGVPSRKFAGNASPVSVYYQRDGRSVRTTALATHTDYTRAAVGRQARMDVSKSSPNFRVAAPAATVNERVGGVRVTRLGACLTQVAANRPVLVIDVARWIGKPAVIIIMRPLSAIDALDVAVVGLTCSASDTHLIITLQVPAG